MRPARVVVYGFAAAILIGTGVLMLPLSSRTGAWTNPVDALFTATSAICVTGLTTLDTATHWSGFGQAAILVMIQLGGLGIMIFATLLGLILARRFTVRRRITAIAESSTLDRSDVRGAIRRVALTSLVIEAIVFALLLPRFALAYDHDVWLATWHALFHSVSAFNNAGFALYSDNLIGFAADPWICLPLCAAIILGGLGFPVLHELRRQFSWPRRWSMNTRLVLVVSAALLVVGTIYITAGEWSNPATLGAYSPGERVLIGFFHSVQTRTAGFNSVDIGLMAEHTRIGMDVLMFIGGGPGGTAGGIKVTTFAVLAFVLLAELRGERVVNIFRKQLAPEVMRQALTVALIAVAAVVTGTIALMVIADLGLDAALFESVSAFATVGLTTGITPGLGAPAKLVLVLLMFLGRLGPLTLGTAIALRERKELFEYPKERPAVG
ncbi:potassium transporter TrkG [Microbacterium fluvii]